MAKVYSEMVSALKLSNDNFLYENSRFFAQQLAESKDEELRLQAAEIFLHLGDYVWATETTSKLTSERERYLHGVALLCLGRYTEAEKVFLISSSPLKAVREEYGLYQLGIVYEKKGEWAKARECFSRCYEKNSQIFDSFRRKILAERRVENEIFFQNTKNVIAQNYCYKNTLAERLNVKGSLNENLHAFSGSKALNEVSISKPSFTLDNLGLVTSNTLANLNPAETPPSALKQIPEANITSLSKLPDLSSEAFLSPCPSRLRKISKNSKENVSFESDLKSLKHHSLRNFLQRLEKPIANLLRGDYAAASSSWTKNFCAFKNSFYVQTQLGTCAAQNGLYEEAERHFSKAEAIFSSPADSKEYFSSCLWSLGRTQRLVSLSATMFQNYPYDFRTWIVLGNCFSSLGDHVSAVRFLSKATSLNGNNSYAHCLMAHEQVSLENLQAAKQSYSRSIELDSLQCSAYWGLGNIALKTEKYTAAINYFTQALNLNPKLATVQTYLGMAYAGANMAEVAQKHFTAAQDLNPHAPINTFHKAWQLFHTQKYSEALREAESLTGLLGEEPKVFVLLGNIHLAMKNFELAHNAYLKALAIDPEDSDKQVRHLLDVLNAQMGETALLFTPQVSLKDLPRPSSI